MKCVHCLLPVSDKAENGDFRYWDKELHGWAHKRCDPDLPISRAEKQARKYFGNPTHRTREAAMTAELASAHGHSVVKEYQDYLNHGTPSRMTRIACSCGYESEWFVAKADATEARRKHLKEAAIYG